MRPTRRSQPYRKGAQQPGQALSAMLQGKPAFLPNPSHPPGKQTRTPPQSGGLRGGLAQQLAASVPRRRKPPKSRRPLTARGMA